LIYFSQPFWMLKTDPFTFFALRLEELKPSWSQVRSAQHG
jgi:hypothetical protein